MQGSKSAVFVALCLSAACRTPSMGQVLADKDRGVGAAQVYPVDSYQAWDIALHAFRWEGAGAIEEHQQDGFMLTSIYRRYANAEGGQINYAGVWIEPAGSGVKVTCVVDGPSFTQQRFHDRFAQALALLQQTGSLPFEAPAPLPEQLTPCTRDAECGVGTCVEGRCRR